MNPPETPVAGQSAEAAASSPAVSVQLQVMRKRADFLSAAKAGRHASPGFVLQARRREEADHGDMIRIGYTCSKKVGNAVARNRAKRRLREIARRILPGAGKPGWDYVLVGREKITATRDFAVLQGDLRSALQRLHQNAK